MNIKLPEEEDFDIAQDFTEAENQFYTNDIHSEFSRSLLNGKISLAKAVF